MDLLGIRAGRGSKRQYFSFDFLLKVCLCLKPSQPSSSSFPLRSLLGLCCHCLLIKLQIRLQSLGGSQAAEDFEPSLSTLTFKLFHTLKS